MASIFDHVKTVPMDPLTEAIVKVAESLNAQALHSSQPDIVTVKKLAQEISQEISAAYHNSEPITPSLRSFQYVIMAAIYYDIARRGNTFPMPDSVRLAILTKHVPDIQQVMMDTIIREVENATGVPLNSAIHFEALSDLAPR